MSITDLGIVEVDFTSNALADFGQTVKRIPKTKKASNSSGSPTYISGKSETFSAIFLRRSQSFDWAKEGLFEDGDAFMQFDKDQSLNKEDIIMVDNTKFRVDNVIERQAAGNALFKSCNLFLIDDEDTAWC